MPERQPTYFLSQTESFDGKSIRIFHAPEIQGFVIPSEVLRLKSEVSSSVGSLWRLVVGLSDRSEFEDAFEASSIEKITNALDRFLRTEPADLIEIAENAPDEIKVALTSVQENLSRESYTRLAHLLGLEIPRNPEEDDRPYPGQYL